MRVARTLAWTLGLASVLVAPGSARASEADIGEPVTRNGITVKAAYLTGVEMAPQPPTPSGDDTIHLECDVSAAANNPQGFPQGAWVPYLGCIYTIEKVGSDWSRTGRMLPMTAQDGPHYANNVAMDGPGEYRLTYYLVPPQSQGFFRHTDAETGVEAWWEPFSVSWMFEYAGQSD